MGDDRNRNDTPFTDLDGNPVDELEVVEKEVPEKPTKGKKEEPEETEEEFEEEEETESKDEEEEGEERDEGEEEGDVDAELQTAREEAAQAKEQAAQLAKQLHDTEIARVKGEKDSAEGLIPQFDGQIKETKAQLIKAKQEGDVETEAMLSDRLDDLKEAKGKCADLAKELSQNLEKLEKEGPSIKQVQDIPPKVRAWVGQNDWFTKEGNEVYVQSARVISAKLHAKGIDPNTDKHFNELSAEMAKLYPKLGVKNLRGEAMVETKGGRRRGGRGKRSAIDGGRTEGSGKETNPRRLTEDDKATMKTFGLDPRNKAHVTEFLSGKVASEKGSKAL